MGATTFCCGSRRMRIARIELREIRMRLLRPFETSFGVTQDRRILLTKVSDGALDGYGEVTAGEGPFYCHETIDTAWYVLSEFVIPAILGKEMEHAADFARIAPAIRGHQMAQGGVE